MARLKIALAVMICCIMRSAAIFAGSETSNKEPNQMAPDWLCARQPIKASQIPKKDYQYLVQWLDSHAKLPQDYIVHLFDTYQVVIFGESHNVKEHKDFVIDLIPRLYHEAGIRCIGWEFSRYTDNKRLDGLVSGDMFDKEAALRFARNQFAHEFNSKEHWDIIEAIWELNRSLKHGQQKMRLIGLDMDWNAPKFHIVIKTKSQDSPEFQEVLKEVIWKRDATMAEQVEKEIIEKGQKGLVFVGRCHDFTHHKFPPNINFGRDIMGNLLYKKYGDRVFQVWLSSGFLLPIEDVMKLREHRPCGFNLYESPFANILTPPNWGDAPNVPLSNVARGFIYFGPSANFHRNTPIKGFVTKEMFEQYKEYYEIDFGRSFNSAEEVDEYLQQHRFPRPSK